MQIPHVVFELENWPVFLLLHNGIYESESRERKKHLCIINPTPFCKYDILLLNFIVKNMTIVFMDPFVIYKGAVANSKMFCNHAIILLTFCLKKGAF